MIEPITLAVAKGFIKQHHRHHPRSPCGHIFSLGLVENGLLLGVVMVGRPGNKYRDQQGYAEVTRLCVSPDAPAHACSQLYAAAVRELRAWNHGHESSAWRWALCTYTLATESGASLRGAGWVRVELPKDSSARRGRRAPGPHKAKGAMEPCPLGEKHFWVKYLITECRVP